MKIKNILMDFSWLDEEEQRDKERERDREKEPGERENLGRSPAPAFQRWFKSEQTEIEKNTKKI